MNIDEFYAADSRRRESQEVELGTEWRDAQGVRYELSWVEDTSELYVMREPPPPVWEDPFGDMYVETGDRAPVSGMTVVVIAQIHTRQQLEQILNGWEEAMVGADSVAWLIERLRTAGVSNSGAGSSQ